MILPPHQRGNLTNAQWLRLKPLLPAQKPSVGRPNNDHRTTINGILWIVRTGAPWRDLPERYGTWETVSGRFYRWRRSGWEQILQQLQQQADANGKWDWEVHHVDGSVIRAHQHAAGAKRGISTQKATCLRLSKSSSVKHEDVLRAGLAPKFIYAVMATDCR